MATLKKAGVGIIRKISGAAYEDKKDLKAHVEYDFPRLSILMPKDHRLGEYQSNNRLYDRFLPHLAKYLPANSAVIDVGANVGDTLAAMYSSNPELNFTCIEPDDEFFSLLESNANRIRTIDKSASISLIKALVGVSVGTVLLEGSGGTKKAVNADGNPVGIKSVSLDSVLDASRTTNLALIKSDVDGYDYDVIESGLELIDTQRPLLFFECQLDHEFQKIAYERLINTLSARGYDLFTVFDNFGEIVIQTSRTGDVSQLFNYVWRQNAKRTTQTIYYYDLLVSQHRHHELVAACVTEYLKIHMPSSEQKEHPT
jgi:FkbM family methyltransferase